MVARLFVVAVALCCASAAYADKHKQPAPTAPELEKPWAAGVSAEDQKAALELYKQGNEFFEQSQYKDALPKYEAAIAHWDHPAIHYNAGICLFNLDRPVEAYDHLVAASRFGAAPFSGDLFQQGQNYIKLLSDRIADLEISCDDVGAKVALDGKDLFVAPGRVAKRVTAGDHQIVTSKDRFQTDKEEVHLNGRDKRSVLIKLKPIAVARKLQRRWDKWKPWAVMVTGGVIATVGIPWLLGSREHVAEYDDHVSNLCPNGCTDAQVEAMFPWVDAQKNIFMRDNHIAEGIPFIGGGAVAVTGFLLVLLNQPRLGPVITPNVESDHVGMVVTGRW